MQRFNLLDEPWIPVQFLTGATSEMGLAEVLERAHDIRDVVSASPLETAALKRLLLALAIRIYVPTAEETDWLDAWREGAFDESQARAYFGSVADRFYLISDNRPFYQNPVPVAAKPKPLASLFHGAAQGNNATLFDHRMDAADPSFSEAELARAIVTIQSFGLGGLAGPGQPTFLHSPAVHGAMFWIRGPSLFHALLLNAPPDHDARLRKDTSDDTTAWERDLPEEYVARPATGILDYLTWQARQVTLAVDEEFGQIERVFLSRGDQLDPPVRDPLTASILSKKRGIIPFQIRADRALWRDANSILRLYDDDRSGGPLALRWLLYLSGRLDQDGLSEQRWSVDCYGFVSNKAKAELWRRESLPVSPAIVEDPDRHYALERALNWAEEQAGIIRYAVGIYVRCHLGTRDESGNWNVDPAAARRLVDSIPWGSYYWSSLEIPFYVLLDRLASCPTSQLDDLSWDWAENMFSAAKIALDRSVGAAARNSRDLRAESEALRRLRRVDDLIEHRKKEQEHEQEHGADQIHRVSTEP